MERVLDVTIPSRVTRWTRCVAGIVLSVTMIAVAAAGALAGVIGIVVGVTARRRADRAVRECADLVQGAVGSHGTVDPRALRDIAIVRYDALNEMSGQLSFSLALLNATGDGVVLSSINGRAETRTYAKPVLAGQGSQELSPEEAQAVQSARLGTGLEGTSASVPAARSGRAAKRAVSPVAPA
jgi:hypothetical protein